MNLFRQCLEICLNWVSFWLKCCLVRLWGALLGGGHGVASLDVAKKCSSQADSVEWRSNKALCEFHSGGLNETCVTIQSSTHQFHVNLKILSESSGYFRALSQSGMRETSQNFIQLDHVSSGVLYNLLQFTFYDRFEVPGEELATHIQVANYLLAETFLSRCLSALAGELSPSNCLAYLSVAQEICCPEMKTTVLAYLSRNLMEMSSLIRCLDKEETEQVVQLRSRGNACLCSLRKENLSSWKDPETEHARQVFVSPGGSEGGGEWRPLTKLPFAADKWCLTAVVLYNYLYVIGGYRERVKKGWEFRMASFRFNPQTVTWATTAPLIKKRRHFSAVACDGWIYAVGGWYLDSLVAPDSNTALYTAMECYDPWKDTWRFVSSLPLSDFRFTMSLSHDVPLATSLSHFLYVLGSVQRTGEKLLLQYNTREDSWSELLPTLTRADADLPVLYFLGATDRLLVIGGNSTDTPGPTSCPQAKRWGQVHRTGKMAFAGQGTITGGGVLLMPSVEHNRVTRMDLETLHTSSLPPLPIPTRYEAIFPLHF